MTIIVSSIFSIATGLYCSQIIASHLSEKRKVYEKDLIEGQTFDTGKIQVSNEQLIGLELYAHVESSSTTWVVEQVRKSYSKRSIRKHRLRLRFNFPVTFKALSEDGAIESSEQTALAWDDQDLKEITKINNESGGAQEVSIIITKFKAPSTFISIVGSIGQDISFGAKANLLKVIVYDHIYDDSILIVTSFLLFIIGGAGISLSLVLYCYKK
jgi:hypothetical protein